MKRLVARLGEPLVRAAVRRRCAFCGAVRARRTIEEAVTRAAARPLYRFSYDMLGEGAAPPKTRRGISIRTCMQ